jgi:asparagine synthase (glutamine-hydrolysing)
MCGFAGFVGYGALNSSKVKAVISRMGDTLTHRGPDDAGIWCDDTNEIALAHRRLSIIDLSSAGHQPMVSKSGRFVVVFNGEIYNHLELRKQLEKYSPELVSWRGNSDTETLLAAIELWGIKKTLQKLLGMFAFSAWDRRQKTLYLARDRMGEKPLYYGWQKGIFLFGSEIKALKTHPAFEKRVDPNVLALFLRHAYIPAPYSIYQSIAKLLPGHWVELQESDLRKQTEVKPQAYWSLITVASQQQPNVHCDSADEAINKLDTLLRNAVRQQMIADVPLGAFLSGGIDSSTIAALMQAQSLTPIKTFSIGLNEDGYNEAIHAKAVAQHLQTDHTELYVSPKEALTVIPQLPSLYDEPFADSSQIPTYLVSKLAKQNVSVSLSGDAGDELFCGYNRYQISYMLWGKLRFFPASLRRQIASILCSVSTETWNKLAKHLPGASRYANFGDKLHKGSTVLSSHTLEELYFRLISTWPEPSKVVLNSNEPPTLLTGSQSDLTNFSSIQRMMLLDSLTYLPDDILAKVDRAAMGVSLETRVPFLDHRVIEFAWKLPQNLKLHDNQSKWILRQVLYKYVPKDLIERPKMGFGIPIGKWLCGPLRDWAESLLDDSHIQQQGFFNPTLTRKKWIEHLSGKRNWQHQLWSLLMFQAWINEQ